MSIAHSTHATYHSDYKDWSTYVSSSPLSYSLLDLVYMWRETPAIKLSFLLNRAMELVGLHNEARLFFLALGGSMDFDYQRAADELCHVAAQYGQYFYSFWKKITEC
jgi:hypothetical protein